MFAKLEVLELTITSTDISVAQWLGLTPPQVVKDTLNLPDEVIANLPKYKNYIVPGNTNLSTTNFTGEGPAGTTYAGTGPIQPKPRN